MGHFKTKKKSLPKGRTGLTKLATPENNFFEKPFFGCIYIRKKIRSDVRVKGY